MHTTLLRNSAGLRLNGSSGVRLDDVLVAGSAADGLVLRGDHGTRLIGIRAEHNGGNGVLVSGPSTDRLVTGISTTGNGGFGIAVVGQTAPRITGVSTRADGTGGLQVSGGADATVSGFAAVDQKIGVFTHVGAARVGPARRAHHRRRARAGGGEDDGRAGADRFPDRGRRDRRRGRRPRRPAAGRGDHRQPLRAAHRTRGGRRHGDRARGHRGPGRGGRGARNHRRAAARPGSEGVANYGVRTAGANAEIIGGRIHGSATGIAADAATTIRGTEIGRVDVGIRARSTQAVVAQAVVVTAVTSGIAVEDGGRVLLTDSQVHAAEAVHGAVDQVGHNDLSLPPLDLLSAIGIPLVLLALLLDQLQRFRARRAARGTTG